MTIQIGDLLKFKGYTTEFLMGVVKDIKQTDKGNVYICHYPNNPKSNIMCVTDDKIAEVFVDSYKRVRNIKQPINFKERAV